MTCLRRLARRMPAAALFLFSLGVLLPSDMIAKELPDDIRRMIELAAEMSAEQTVATAKLAAKAAPGHEMEILAVVAAKAPEHAAPVAEALGLRDRTAQAAVQAAQQAATAKQIAEAAKAKERPRFWSFEGWDGSFSLGAARSTGNTDEASFAAQLKAARAHEKWSYELDLKLDMEATNGETTQQRFDSSFQVNRAIHDRLYAFGTVKYEDDAFSGFEYRGLVSSGLGWFAVKKPKVTWRLQAGPSARFDRIDGGDLETSVGGLAESLFTWKPKEKVIIENKTEAVLGQLATIQNITSVQAPVFDQFAIRLSYDVRYNFDPPADTEELDTITRASVVYTF